MIAIVAVALAPLPVAAADSVVPPGNSAVTQYTETLPGAGGELELGSEIDAGGGAKALDRRQTQALESQGADGRAVVAITVTTAPAPVAPAEGSGEGGSGAGRPAATKGGGATLPAQRDRVPLDRGGGSSGLGEVLGQATGADSGKLGLALPLLLLGVVAWAAAYAVRRWRFAE